MQIQTKLGWHAYMCLHRFRLHRIIVCAVLTPQKKNYLHNSDCTTFNLVCAILAPQNMVCLHKFDITRKLSTQLWLHKKRSAQIWFQPKKCLHSLAPQSTCLHIFDSTHKMSARFCLHKKKSAQSWLNNKNTYVCTAVSPQINMFVCTTLTPQKPCLLSFDSAQNIVV